MSEISSAIERALKVKALRELAREIGVAEAVGVLAAMVDRTPRRSLKPPKRPIEPSSSLSSIAWSWREKAGKRRGFWHAATRPTCLIRPRSPRSKTIPPMAARRKRARARLPGARCARRPA